jgi:formylglycine-generating enzyme required for sulfatase activity
MVWIPDGTFVMGSGKGTIAERPVHEQRVQGFWMYTKEVTNAQFRKFVGAYPQWSPEQIPRLYHDGHYLKHWRDESSMISKEDEYPAVYMSWYAAKAYAEWAGGRLPTEVEWEYAARAGKQLDYGTATGKLSRDLANYSGTGGKDRWSFTAPVGSFPPNPFGLYDMTGNAAEWTSSLHKPYPYSATDGREHPDMRAARVLRGGSWDDREFMSRATDRGSLGPTCCYGGMIGFRCVVPGPKPD